MKFINRLLRKILPVLLVLFVFGCQLIPNQVTTTPSIPNENLTSLTPSPVSIKPTATVQATPVTNTLEPQPTDILPKAISQNFIRGLRITLVHPWVNATADAFEAIIGEFNKTNELGIEVICRRAGGSIALSEALIDGSIRDHLVLTYGFDLAGVDSGKTWVNLSDAPGIEGITQDGNICPNCTNYLDQLNQDRFVSVLYQPSLLYYNQTWAKALGFEEPPLTLDDLQVQMQAAAASLLKDFNVDNNGAGGLWLSMSPESALAWYRVFGGTFDQADELTVFTREPLEQSFNYLKKLRGSSGSWQAQNQTAHQFFAKRTSLAYEGTLDDLFPQEIAFELANSADEWSTLPYPSADGSGSISMETMSISISSTYDRAEASSAYFVRWLLQPEQQKKLIEVTGLWPVLGNPVQLAPDFAVAHPAWASALDRSDQIKVAPEGKNWGLSRLILKDANMRLYSLDAQFIPMILDTLDATLVEAGGAE